MAHRTARVLSIEAVEAMTAATRRFGEEAAIILENLDVELRRAVDWIEQDRRLFWKGEVDRGWNRVNEARGDLERALTYRRTSEHQPACREERAALDRAKRRLDLAMAKVEAVRRWTHVIEHQVREVIAAARGLRDWVQGDLPRALAQLERMSAALEAYAASAQASAADALAAMRSETSTQQETSNAHLGSQLAQRPAEAGLEGSASGAGRDHESLERSEQPEVPGDLPGPA